MTVSMTAYGRAEYRDALGQASCEIRSVNHRYLEMSVRLPEELRALEQKIRDRISAKLKRGKVDCTIRFELSTISSDSIPVNQDLLDKLIETTEATANKLADSAPVNPLELLRWPGVLDREVADQETIAKVVFQIVDEALEAVVATRAREGEKIRSMILERCDKSKAIVDLVQEKMPEILESLRDNNQQRAQELVTEIDHDRLEQELVMLSQKMDVAEEMDRLHAHISEVARVMDQSGPIGRRLDFLMQEMNREANTLGSKSAHLDTSNASVDLKVLIEQMREQIQNIE